MVAVVGNNGEHSNAGITGQGVSAESVRFWAGSTFDNRSSAKFRVQQNGKLYAMDGVFSGEITATKGSFSGEVSVGSLSGWKVPGIIGIYHMGASLSSVYATGSFSVGSFQRTAKGEYTIRHNIGHTNYTVIHAGIPRSGDILGFLGDFRCTSLSINSIRIQFKDTSNNNHDLDINAAADIIFIGYAIQ
jgi:hypothetical protein